MGSRNHANGTAYLEKPVTSSIYDACTFHFCNVLNEPLTKLHAHQLADLRSGTIGVPMGMGMLSPKLGAHVAPSHQQFSRPVLTPHVHHVLITDDPESADTYSTGQLHGNISK